MQTIIMQTIARTMLVLMLAAYGLGCGEGGSDSFTGSFTGSCDLRKLQGMCMEYEGQTPSDAATLQSSCAKLSQWSSGRCTREGAVGGCRIKHERSGHLIGWFYPGSSYETAAEVQPYCDSKSGTFLSP